jgi:hypothetical protein
MPAPCSTGFAGPSSPGTRLTKSRRLAWPRLDATFSDLVAFGEISHSGRIPTHGAAAAELARLLDELVVLGWVGCHARAY